MNIHEYQAKQILRKYGVPTSHGVVALKEKEIDDLIDNLEANIYVVKAQIHAGGRGKAGGVKVVRNKEDAKEAAHNMFGKTLVTHQTGPLGQKVRRVYVESGYNKVSGYLEYTNPLLCISSCYQASVTMQFDINPAFRRAHPLREGAPLIHHKTNGSIHVVLHPVQCTVN